MKAGLTHLLLKVAYTPAALRVIYGGKAYKRGMEQYITNSLAIMMIRFHTISSDLLHEYFRKQCECLQNALYERSPYMMVIYETIQT